MKKILLILALAICAGASSQPDTTYKLVNGKIIAVLSIAKPVTKDSVYQVINGRKFYKGTRGGIYYYKTSKEGKVYKQYIKQ